MTLPSHEFHLFATEIPTQLSQFRHKSQPNSTNPSQNPNPTITSFPLILFPYIQSVIAHTPNHQVMHGEINQIDLGWEGFGNVFDWDWKGSFLESRLLGAGLHHPVNDACDEDILKSPSNGIGRYRHIWRGPSIFSSFILARMLKISYLLPEGACHD